jgi:hypothetical protein
MAWASSVPARRHDGEWELLLRQPWTQQQMAPPDPIAAQATERMVRLAPIAPGEAVKLNAGLVAMYQHGGKLTATLRYVSLDPKQLLLCSPESPSGPMPTFVACRPATRGDLHTPAADLGKISKTVTARARLDVIHPAFDVGAARARAKVSAGRFGYERHTQRWILVEAAGQRTLVIGADGSPEDLPGDWLEQLLELDGSETVNVWWMLPSPRDTRTIIERVRKDGISIEMFAFKGPPDPTRLILTLQRADVAALSADMRALGYRMTEDGITP